MNHDLGPIRDDLAVGVVVAHILGGYARIPIDDRDSARAYTLQRRNDKECGKLHLDTDHTTPLPNSEILPHRLGGVEKVRCQQDALVSFLACLLRDPRKCAYNLVMSSRRIGERHQPWSQALVTNRACRYDQLPIGDRVIKRSARACSDHHLGPTPRELLEADTGPGAAHTV